MFTPLQTFYEMFWRKIIELSQYYDASELNLKRKITSLSEWSEEVARETKEFDSQTKTVRVRAEIHTIVINAKRHVLDLLQVRIWENAKRRKNNCRYLFSYAEFFLAENVENEKRVRSKFTSCHSEMLNLPSVKKNTEVF